MSNIINNNPTLFVAVCAIFVPVLITTIKCLFDLIIRRCQSKKEHEHKIKYEQRQVYASYLRYAGQYLLHSSVENQSNYGEAYFQILAVVPKDLRDKIIECNDLIREKRNKDATKKLEEIIPEVQNILNTLY